MEENHFETRQERRETRLRKRVEHMQRHGAGLAKVYRNALEKRSKKSTDKKRRQVRQTDADPL